MFKKEKICKGAAGGYLYVCVEVLLKAVIYKGCLVNYIMLNHPAAREPAVLWCQSLSNSVM